MRVMHGHAALVLGICATSIYVASAIVSFWYSYDQGAGREKLTLMLLGLLLPLTLAVTVRHRIETVIGVLGVILGLFVPFLGAASMMVESMDKGAAAGDLAVLIPLVGCGLVWATARGNHVLQVVLAVCAVVASIVVILSGEHSAIIGLVIGLTIGFGTLWRYRVAAPSPWLRVLDIAVLILALLSIAVYLSLILVPDRVGQLWQTLPAYYAQRFASWRETPAVIDDYLLTGSGMGGAAMVLSSYLFMVHVPYFNHVHNLFLQVGIEQGIAGMVGMVGMFFAAFWSMRIAMRRAHAYVAVCAASVFASLLSLFVSGLLESDVYNDVWVVGLFLPFGFAWVLAQHDVSLWARRTGVSNRPRPFDWAIGLIPVLLLAVLVARPGFQAKWIANQATLAQTKAELADYVVGLSPSPDDLRRDGEVDLSAPIELYRQALKEDPSNVTALRRLAQIEIARGDYDAALLNLQRAYQTAPGQRTTRQLLGEMYAIEGRIDEATALWRTIRVAPQLLKNRLWWYEHIGDQQSAENIRAAMQHLGL
jgi:hypothetical protein